MKRYVKVKRDDEILIYDTDDCTEGFNFYTNKTGLYYGKTTIEYFGEIVKDSDNLGELCDGFIFKDTEANELHFLDKNDGISLLGASLFTETVRGYIETNKGLIYVAKLNDKRELELL